MLSTFENAERQHLRRKERELHLQAIDRIGMDSAGAASSSYQGFLEDIAEDDDAPGLYHQDDSGQFSVSTSTNLLPSPSTQTYSMRNTTPSTRDALMVTNHSRMQHDKKHRRLAAAAPSSEEDEVNVVTTSRAFSSYPSVLGRLSRRNRYLLAGGLVLVLAAIIIGCSVGLSSKSKNIPATPPAAASSTPEDGAVSSPPPLDEQQPRTGDVPAEQDQTTSKEDDSVGSQQPSFLTGKTKAELARYNHLVNLVLDWEVTSKATLQDSTTPQSQALQWLAFADNANVMTALPNPETLRTRFALATLYYSTTRDDSVTTGATADVTTFTVTSRPRVWNEDHNWLSVYPVCLWHGVECHDKDTRALGLVKAINLSANGLVGELPAEIGLLQRFLQNLDVSNNRLSGLLPDFSALVNLQQLFLGPNPTLQAAPIPESIYTLKHLTHLYMNECQLTGAISPLLGTQLTQLHGLGLHQNSLRGPIPDTLDGLTKLIALYLDHNELMGGIPRIPASVVDLRLGNNRLTGSIPHEAIANAQSLQILYLNNNDLEGSIPPALISELPLLMDVQLYGNRLGGEIPAEFGFLDLLNVLYLDDNLFVGGIPDLSGLKLIESLYLFNNSLTGEIPEWFADLEESLVHLRLDQNQFRGQLPAALGRLVLLETLDVSNNAQLVGHVPVEYQSLTKLKQARFHDTNLSLESLSKAFCSALDPTHVRSSTSLTTLKANCKDNYSGTATCTCCTECE